MDRHHGGDVGSLEALKGEQVKELIVRIEHTLRFSQNPAFSDQQISYLEDLLANKLLGIVVHSRSGHRCSECFGVIDTVLEHIRSLRIEVRH
jgi:hypothetical protein